MAINSISLEEAYKHIDSGQSDNSNAKLNSSASASDLAEHVRKISEESTKPSNVASDPPTEEKITPPEDADRLIEIRREFDQNKKDLQNENGGSDDPNDPTKGPITPKTTQHHLSQDHTLQISRRNLKNRNDTL